MQRKGMLSLEMIIGFIILIVVAAIIIDMLITTIKPDKIESRTTELDQMKFKNDCKALCSDTESIDYCMTYFTGNKKGIVDWSGNGIENEIIEMSGWDVCEDRIYCFMASPCERFGSNSIKGCANALCKFYLEKYDGDVLNANEAVLDKIKPGSCNLETEVKEIDNWYLRFFKPDVCGCKCSNWVSQGIGLSGINVSCNSTQMYQNRTCEPVGCREPIERCITAYTR